MTSCSNLVLTYRPCSLVAREAPYAKARTQFGRDVQMTKHYRPHEARNNAESGSNLLS